MITAKKANKLSKEWSCLRSEEDCVSNQIEIAALNGKSRIQTNLTIDLIVKLKSRGYSVVDLFSDQPSILEGVKRYCEVSW